MRRMLLGCVLWSLAMLPGAAGAVTPAPALTDREIAERLTRLETRLDEGLKGVRESIAQLRDDMNTRFEEQSRQNRQLYDDMGEQNRRLYDDMGEQNRRLYDDMGEQNRQLRVDIQEQNRQLRDDMNSRFEEQGRLILGLLAVFGTIIAVNIGLIVWDRRTSVRPLEEKVSVLAGEVAKNGEQGQTLLEVFRTIGQQNQTVAAVLKRFNLL